MNEPPAAGVVRVAGPEGAGTGFLASASGLIVTCAHVLAGAAAGDTVRVEPHADRRPLVATVVLLWDPPDVAVLQLAGEVPQEATVLPLGRSPRGPRQGLRTFGYPQLRAEAGLPGEIAYVGPSSDAGYAQLALRSEEATLGFSGAPIWDPELGAVVGMVKSIARADPGQRLGNTAIGVPVEVIRGLWPELRLPAGCPYRGLEPFTEEHADYYYGREHATGQLLASLAARDFVAVVAVSGGGKSSLLQAGLAKGLRDRPITGLAQRVRCYQRVGSHPHAELLDCLAQRRMPLPRELAEAPPSEVAAAVLGAAPPAGLIVVVDQFERLYTDCADAERKRFVELLLRLATDTVKVVIGLRADFYHLALADLGERLAAEQVALAPMSEQDLRRAIAEPAGRLLRSFQPGLAQRLAADVRGRPGDLPLLQFALTRLWERDEADGVLTEETYRGLGAPLADGTHLPGAQGVLIRQAEQLWQGLSPADRPRLRRILLGLIAAQSGRASVSPLEDSPRDLSRPALLAQWDQDDQRLIQQLIAARLLTAGRAAVGGQATVEVSHEALLRSWPGLRTWLEPEEHWKFVQWRAQDLAPNLERWLSSRKSPGSKGNPEFLLPRSLLEPALRWLGGYPDELAGPPADYIRASRLRRTLRRSLAGSAVAVLAIASLAAAGIFFSLQQAAVQQHNTVISEREVAASNALADQSQATRGADPVLARLEAAAAWQLDPSPRASYAMLSAAVNPWTAVLNSHTVNQQHSIAISPGGTLLAAGTSGGTQLWNLTTHKPITTLPASGFGIDDGTPSIPGPVNSVAFSPRGTLLAAGTNGGAQLWNLTTHKLITTLPAGPAVSILNSINVDTVNSVAFSPDGTLLAAGVEKPMANAPDGGIQLWDVTTRKLITTLLAGTAYSVHAVAFSPDGTLLAAGIDKPITAAEPNGGIQLWDVTTRKLITTLPSGNSSYDDAVAFSPDGRLLAAGAGRGAQLWNLTTRKLITTLPSDNAFYDAAVAFSPNGRLLAADTGDEIELWDAATGTIITSLGVSTANSSNSVAFSPDGTLLAVGTGHDTGLANLTDSTTLPSLSTLSAENGGPTGSAAFSPDDSLLVANTYGGAQLWNVATRRLVITFPASEPANSASAVAFSPDGKLLAVGTGNLYYGATQLRDVATGRLVATFPASAPASSVAFSPDGRLLAIGAGNETQIWDVTTRKLISTLPAHTTPDSPDAMAFSPDGTLLATADATDGAQVWDLATRTIVTTLPVSTGNLAYSMAFSPGGTLLAAGTSNGTYLWDVATRKLVTTLGVGNPAYSMAFSPDGTTLLIGTGTSEELWDVKTLQQFDTLDLPDATDFVMLSHNGVLLATRAIGGSIELLDVPYLRSTLSYLCRLAGESFPPAEWAKYAPGVPYMKTCP